MDSRPKISLLLIPGRAGHLPATGARKATRLLAALIGVSVVLMLYWSSPSSAQRWHASSKRLPQPQTPQPLDDMAHMSWTRRDGAPSDIAALAQTTDGYLWIASRRGLFRFDGLAFQSYPFTSTDPPLPSSDIAALTADKTGGLWIGFRMGGMTYLHDGKKVDYGRGNGLVSESTEQLFCASDGSIWATADGRLMHLAGSTWENYSLKHGLSSDGLYSLFFDRDGNLWTADKGHVYELKKGEDKFLTTDLPGSTINQFLQFADGTIWISDAWKSVRPLHDQRPAVAVRIPGVPVMLGDTNNNLWLANEFGGVTRIKHPGTAARQVEKYGVGNGLTDGQTRAILQDAQGTIWVATARGLDRFRPSFLVQFRGVSLEYNPALMADRNGGIWLHDMDKPLMRLQGGRLSFVSEGHGSSSLFQDTDGSVWMLDQITRTFYRYPEDGGAPLRIAAPEAGREVETWCMGKDPNGVFLACFEGHGLWRYTDGKWDRVTAAQLPQESPLSLVRGEAGRVWLGYAHNQIVLMDAHGFHQYGQQDNLEVISVFTFYDAGGLVLAGGSEGLAYFDGRSFHSLHLRSPELLRGISGIVKDRLGDLWLNAGLGVVRLPAAEWQKAIKNPGYAMDFRLINEQAGLIGTPAQNKPTPSAIVDKSGMLWFATSGHIVSIDPAASRQNPSTPNLLLQSVIINRKAYPYTAGVEITQNSLRMKTLEFDYNGVDLSSPERVVYQYMLENQDKDWQDVGPRRQAYYTNLSPGKYRFRVRAATGTGPWTELPSGPMLTVTPPFYQSIWFYALSVFVICGLLWLIYRARLQYLTSQVQERLEERAHERIRIARDLHDTLLQGVQGLMLRFHFATEKLPAEEPVRTLLRDALDRADRVIQEGREKVRELRAETTPATELETHLRKAASALTTDGIPRIDLVVVGEPRALYPVVSDELYSIGREALTNAVNHAGATQILVELTYDFKELRLRCVDNGRGIKSDILQAGFKDGHWGIIGMRERARNLGCKLVMSSKPDMGTEVQVCVAAKKAYANADGDPQSFWRIHLSSRLKMRPLVTSANEEVRADQNIEVG